MSDHDHSTPPDALVEILKTLAEGGLPQVIAGPAGKAISRLIAGAADIPAAWLEKHAQSIRDEKNARSTIIKTIADAAAKTAGADPQVVDRAISRFANDLCRKQENREAVARLTVEQLRIDPPPLESEGPTDDWMNLFQRCAEDASSDDFRIIWAKILAGEVRKPGEFSPRTLQTLTSIDADLAKLIERVMKYDLNGSLPNVSLEQNFTFEERFALEDIGIIANPGQFGSNLVIKIGSDHYGHVFTDQFIFRVKVPKDTALSCYLFTRLGRDLQKALNIEIDTISVAQSLWAANPKPSTVEFTQITARKGQEVHFGAWHTSQPRESVSGSSP